MVSALDSESGGWVQALARAVHFVLGQVYLIMHLISYVSCYLVFVMYSIILHNFRIVNFSLIFCF